MEALEFLKQEVKTYNEMSITGLNNLPLVLYDSVAAAMETYAKYYHETEVKKLNIADVMRSLPLQEFMDEVEYMQGLYGKQRYTKAEQVRDKLAEKLDDVMRAGGQ